MTWRTGRRLALVGAAGTLGASALVLSGIGSQLASSVATLGRLQPGALGAALAFSVLSALLSGVVWWRLLQRLGHMVEYRAALSAALSAGLAGYVVNIAGPALGSALSLRRHGVGPGRAVLLTLIANALGFLGILAWAPLGLLLLAGARMDTALPLLGHYGPVAVDGAVAALAAVMLLALRVLAAAAGSGHRLARLSRGRLGGGDRGAWPAPRYAQLLAIVPYSALAWVTGALALYVVLAAMSPGASLSLGAVAGSAVVAAVLGSLAFFAPEGVGVKDGVLVAMLVHATGLPLPTCVAGALAVRALDPVTKLGLLGAVAATAHMARARRLAGAVPSLLHGLPRLRTRAALLSAGVLVLWMVPSGAGALAHAGRERLADHDARSAAVTPAALADHQPMLADVGARAVFRAGTPHP